MGWWWGKYVGKFKDFERHGQGIIFNYFGEIQHIGEFKDGWKDGYGTHIYYNKGGDSDKYIGEWKRGRKHGQGTYTYADGTIEKGLWENDEFIGE